MASLEAEAEKAGSTANADALRRLRRQLYNVFALNLPFGDAVVRLLDYYGLPDASILDEYYKAGSVKDVQTWSQALSRFRGIAVHEGTFGASDFLETSKVWLHLLDVTSRILLKMLGFSGKYEQKVGRYRTLEPVDWVTPSTPVEELGFRDIEDD